MFRDTVGEDKLFQYVNNSFHLFKIFNGISFYSAVEVISICLLPLNVVWMASIPIVKRSV